MYNRNDDYIFRSEMNIQLHETRTVNDELMNDYNRLYIPSTSLKKDYFEFFYWIFDYMIRARKFDEELFENTIEKYNEYHPFTEKERTFLSLCFRVNKYNYGFYDSNKYEFATLIDQLLNLCEELNINDVDTLLNLKRLKLRLSLNKNPLTDELLEVIKQYKAEVEELMTDEVGTDKEHSIIM